MSLDVKVYRIVSFRDPIIDFAVTGNVVAIQEMISNGTATPNDRDDTCGWSLLDVCLSTRCFLFCRIILLIIISGQPVMARWKSVGCL
jgi:hypothetical protein